MFRKKQVITMVSVVVISFLIGTMFNVKAMATDGGNPFNKIWEAICDLQARVTSLEESTNTKTWHFVTNFTLSNEETVSPLFYVQGEKWRIKWEPEEGTWEPTRILLMVFDENGYVIDHLEVSILAEYHPQHPNDARGIYYMAHGEGSYYMEVLSIGEDRANFTIESYH